MAEEEILEKNIEQLINLAGAQLHLADDKRREILEKLIGAQSSAGAAGERRPVWERTVRSRITRLAAAVAVVITLAVCIGKFGVPDGARVAFGRVREAVNSRPWLHATFTGEMRSRNLNYDYEIWLSPVRQIRIHKVGPASRIYWSDYWRRQRTVFDPTSNTIKLSYEYECDQFRKLFSERAEPPWSYVSPMFDPEAMTSEGTITEHKEMFGKRNVRVYKVLKREEKVTVHFEIVTDIENNLPIVITVEATDSNGQTVCHVEGRCDYPEEGPADVYELGVPKDAKVIDELPRAGAEELLEICKKYRSNFESYVIIVILESQVGIDGIEVNYVNGDTFKAGRYFKEISYLYSFEGENSSRLNSKVEKGFDSMLEWIRSERETLLMSVDLWDGSYRHTVQRNREPSYQQATNIGGRRDIYGYAWPYAQPAGRIIENEYSSRNGFICLRAYGSLFYFDPQHDYICMRRDYLEDYNDVTANYGLIKEVTELAQTREGRWYPRKVAHMRVNKNSEGQEISREITGVSNIYVKIVSEFPAGIFDVKNLPRAIE